MAGFNPPPVFGLTIQNTNEEIRQKAFQFVHEIGYMIFATISCNEQIPSARGLEVHYLDESTNFYIGMGKGKPVFYDLLQCPYITGCITKMTDKDLALSVRIIAHVKLILPDQRPDIYEKYWELNPGTKALYRKDLDMFRIFCLDAGEGEIFHLPDDDEISRIRFSFGAGKKRQWAYTITQACIGCGSCAEQCMRNVIHCNENGKYEIDYQGCLECGRCYLTCPNHAIRCNCKDT